MPTSGAVASCIEQLRAWVLAGAAAPGTPITEQGWAQLAGVSRPTARTAITILVQEGLLHRAAHRSAVVPELSPADLADVFGLRLAIEPQVVRSLAAGHAGPAALAAAGQAVQALAGAGDAPRTQLVAADIGFHRALVAALGSPRIARVFDQLAGEVQLSMIHSQRELGTQRIAAEHAQILARVQAADPDGAGQAMAEHLQSALQILLASLGQAADQQPVPAGG